MRFMVLLTEQKRASYLETLTRSAWDPVQQLRLLPDIYGIRYRSSYKNHTASVCFVKSCPVTDLFNGVYYFLPLRALHIDTFGLNTVHQIFSQCCSEIMYLLKIGAVKVNFT